MQTTTDTNNAPQWAIIELMGHIRYGGLVSKDTQLGTAMLRVDVPQADTDGFVSQLVNPASIYRITFCEAAIARAAARAGDPKPMSPWELRQMLPEPTAATTTRDQDDDDREQFPDGDEDHHNEEIF